MDAKETLKIISKQWCDMKDLMKLSRLGINNATRLRGEIKDNLESNGYILPKGLIPMSEVVNKLHIDVDYLRKVSTN